MQPINTKSNIQRSVLPKNKINRSRGVSGVSKNNFKKNAFAILSNENIKLNKKSSNTVNNFDFNDYY
jgi:protein-tyrosine-phosphatase